MNEFDILKKYWPEREIFQGSARAYIRYNERWQLPWNGFEKPLWEDLFGRLELKDAIILDVGTGTGKLVELMLEHKATNSNIFALEPNPIMLNYLSEKNLGIGCIADTGYSLDSWVIQQIGLDLITANMVANHLSTTEYNKLIKDAATALLLNGVLAYTVPDPDRKMKRYHLDENDNEKIMVEDAPWGGLVEYHHRSKEYQKQILIASGFEPKLIFGGYDDTWHTHDGPKRMLVVARKKKNVYERVSPPPEL